MEVIFSNLIGLPMRVSIFDGNLYHTTMVGAKDYNKPMVFTYIINQITISVASDNIEGLGEDEANPVFRVWGNKTLTPTNGMIINLLLEGGVGGNCCTSNNFNKLEGPSCQIKQGIQEIIYCEYSGFNEGSLYICTDNQANSDIYFAGLYNIPTVTIYYYIMIFLFLLIVTIAILIAFVT